MRAMPDHAGSTARCAPLSGTLASSASMPPGAVSSTCSQIGRTASDENRMSTVRIARRPLNSSQPGTRASVECRITVPGLTCNGAPPSKPKPNCPSRMIANPILGTAVPSTAQSVTGVPS
ncbi:hypothetical protein G6F66_014601 [Rhizopus arrhizus]|nr:hypothetical protein G6F66_014601 [Rhizopus arrhizus]